MQVKEKKEPERLKKGPFPWQMILFTAVLTVAGICSLLLEKPDVSEMEQIHPLLCLLLYGQQMLFQFALQKKR